jgi:4-diphosphocytidyl-2-C-methyl-D-erythritol kinase
MDLQRLAPAKVNLFLHVGPLGADGYHPLRSLVTFADVGDIVRLRSATAMGFEIEGPLGAELERDADNLVVRARDLALAGHPGAPPFQLILDKRLPIAAGLGGGSADAAATLRLIGEALGWRASGDDADLMRIAGGLGADVPMCLAGRPAVAEGRGDILRPAPAFPDLDAVLVNPLRPSPTGAVYRAYDAAGAPGGADAPDWPASLATARAVADFLAACRNDLEAPAIGLQPAIAEALAALRAAPETLIARMSGSGATCFALCADEAAARRLGSKIVSGQPGWWVQCCRLAGFGVEGLLS